MQRILLGVQRGRRRGGEGGREARVAEGEEAEKKSTECQLKCLNGPNRLEKIP